MSFVWGCVGVFVVVDVVVVVSADVDGPSLGGRIVAAAAVVAAVQPAVVDCGLGPWSRLLRNSVVSISGGGGGGGR